MPGKLGVTHEDIKTELKRTTHLSETEVDKTVELGRQFIIRDIKAHLETGDLPGLLNSLLLQEEGEPSAIEAAVTPMAGELTDTLNEQLGMDRAEAGTVAGILVPAMLRQIGEELKHMNKNTPAGLIEMFDLHQDNEFVYKVKSRFR